MKSKIFTLFFFMTIGAGTMTAETIFSILIGNLYYNLDKENKTAEVTRKDSYSGYDLTTADIPASVIYNEETYSVTSIRDYAFDNSENLVSVAIPNSVTYIGEDAFWGCSSLENINVDKENAYYCDVNGVLFDKEIISLITYPIGKSDPEYTIPGTVTRIEENAFANCEHLTTVIIPNSVTTINVFAFGHCTGLTSIKIPDSVEWLGMEAFHNCSNLESVTIGNGLTVLEDDVFAGCTSLISIQIPNSITEIMGGAFAGCSGLTFLEIPNSVTKIDWLAFTGCSSLSSLVIGSGVEYISGVAFLGCDGLVSIIVDSENKIFDSRDNCNAIIETESNTLIYCCANTTIPSSVTKIGDAAFYKKKITDISIPNSVTSIGVLAFSDCSELTSLVIPESVQTIGNGAFADCVGLKSITCHALTPPEIEYDDNGLVSPLLDIFDGVDKSIPLYVPKGSIALYKNAEQWKKFDIRAITESPSAISDAQTGKTQMTKVYMDGRFYVIIKEGEQSIMYDMTGTRVRSLN